MRTLQLKTDKEMMAFAQQASAEIEAMTSAGAIYALQQRLATDLLARELNYLREIEKIMGEASAMAAATLRESRNPWQERMARLSQEEGQFLADGGALRAAVGQA
ncbi:hypothetical protein ACXIUT_12195 [Achromobacter denitrificans]